MVNKITVIGTGYVGLIAAVGLADFGNHVIGVDIDQDKVDLLNQGISPIYEPGVQEYLKRNLKDTRLTFTTNIDKAIQESSIILIAVGTPAKANGEADLSQISAAIESIANNLNEYKIIVTKSTVPVGTNKWIKDNLQSLVGNKHFDVISNPEFLREGKATHDFFHPDRIVIGYESERAKMIMKSVYRALHVPFVWCNLETAELIKYASNAFLATKITFINQMANLAEAVGGDIDIIAKSMGMDARISPKFLNPGPGYGGSCFPKDTRAIVEIGKQYGVDMSLIDEVINANEQQKYRMVEKLEDLLDSTLAGSRIAILGLAFKAETDDIRESPAITLVEELLQKGALIQAHDPKAMDNFSRLFPDITYCNDEYRAIEGADALVICTEWNEYRNLDISRLKETMRGSYILDTRNILSSDDVNSIGFTLESVGHVRINGEIKEKIKLCS